MTRAPARAARARAGARALALGLALWLALDVGVAQAAKRIVPTWDVPAGERRYRVPSDAFHHALRPDVRLTAYWGGIPYPYATNSLGFRDAAPRAVPLRGSGPRLLLLGDSFTEGLGVPYEQTFAGVLAARLRPRGIEVLNAAVSSYAPSVHRRRLAYLLDEVGLSVDAVVVFVDLSDAYDEVERYREAPDGRLVDALPPEGARARAVRIAKNNSLLLHVGAMFKAGWDRHRGIAGAPERGLDRPQSRWTSDTAAYRAYGEEGLRRGAVQLDGLLAVARAHELPVALVVYPWPDQIAHGERAPVHVAFWRDWAAAHGVRFIDLFPEFVDPALGPRAIAEYYIPYDVHWNAAGHRRVADALLRAGLGDLAREPAAAPTAAGVAARAEDQR